MPISSAQIAQMNGAFQQQSMQQMQYSSMIGQGQGYGGGGGYGGQSIGEAAAGRGANLASASAPLAYGAMAIAGVDPLSMGMKAAWGARGAGMMGAGAAGMAVAAPLAIGMMGAQYVGGQMMEGMQESQRFSGQMRSSYGFMNRQGGRGFTRSDLSHIEGTIRGESTMQGSMGQMVGFDELGRLASNMGRMGMAKGVTDAREFSQRFREMLTSVKQIATDMGSSLEEAQKMMGSMKGAGIFGMKSQAAFASQAASLAGTAGVGITEMTSAMGMGAGISRQIGGRGRHGAIAGMRSMTSIGMALRQGTLTEEDIYDQTGRTGAAGRMAMAEAGLSQSAAMLSGRFGKIMTAQLAGANGGVDEGAVNDLIYGGGSTTRSSAYGGVARAGGKISFMRNQGKIRGAILGRLGDMAAPLQMAQWLKQKGYDPMEGGDKSMIAFQRYTGMGSDEAQNMVNRMRDLPLQMAQMEEFQVKSDMAKDIRQRQGMQGIPGLKKKFEKAKADIQGNIRRAGSRWQDNMAKWVDRVVSDITGTVVEEYRVGASDIMGTYMSGGTEGTLASRSAGALLGLGKGAVDFSGVTGFDRGAGMSQLESFEKFDSERMAKAGISISNIHGQTAAQRLEENSSRLVQNTGIGGRHAGAVRSVGPDPNRRRDANADVGRLIQQSEGVTRIMQGVTSPLHSKDFNRLREMGSTTKGDLMKALSDGEIGGQNLERLHSVGAWMEKTGHPGAEAFNESLSKGDMTGAAAQWSAIAQGAMGSENLQTERSLFGGMKSLSLSGGALWKTEGEKREVFAKNFRGGDEVSGWGIAGGTAASVLSASLAGLTGGVATIGNELGSAMSDKGSSAEGFFKAAATITNPFRAGKAGYRATADVQSDKIAKFLTTQKNEDLTLQLASGSEDVREAAQSTVQDMKLQLRARLTKIQSGESGGSEDIVKADLASLTAMERFGKVQTGEMSKTTYMDLRMGEGATREEAVGEMQTLQKGALASEKRNRAAAVKEWAGVAKKKVRKWEKSGLISTGGAYGSDEDGNVLSEKQGFMSRKAMEAFGDVGERRGAMWGKGIDPSALEGTGDDAVGPSGGKELTQGQAFMQRMTRIEVLGASFESVERVQGQEGLDRLIAEQKQLRDEAQTIEAGMSGADRDKLARTAAEQGATGIAGRISYKRNIEKVLDSRHAKALRGRLPGEKGGGLVGLLKSQGAGESFVNLGRKMAAGVVEDGKRRDFTLDEQAGMLGQQMFGTDLMGKDLKDQLKESISASSAGKSSAASELILQARGSAEGQELTAKKQRQEASPGDQMIITAIEGLPAKLKTALPTAGQIGDAVGGKVADAMGDDSGTCFPGSVKVLMADGTEKVIEDVRVGDEVVSVDVLTGSVHTAEVVDLHNHLVGTDIVEVNGVAMTTNHPIWVNDGWVLGEDIKIGDTIHQMKSSWSEPVPGLVTSVVRIPKAELGEFSVYNIFVAEHGNYVAGGLLASEDC